MGPGCQIPLYIEAQLELSPISHTYPALNIMVFISNQPSAEFNIVAYSDVDWAFNIDDESAKEYPLSGDVQVQPSYP